MNWRICRFLKWAGIELDGSQRLILGHLHDDIILLPVPACFMNFLCNHPDDVISIICISRLSKPYNSEIAHSLLVKLYCRPIQNCVKNRFSKYGLIYLWHITTTIACVTTTSSGNMGEKYCLAEMTKIWLCVRFQRLQITEIFPQVIKWIKISEFVFSVLSYTPVLFYSPIPH